MATPFGEDYEQFSRSDLTESDCFLSNCLIADSTLATISVAGILVGVIAKFNPFCSSETSVSLRDLEDRLITHLHSCQYKVYWSAKEGCFLLKEFIKFTLLLVFGLIKDSLSVATDLFKCMRSIFGRKS